MMICHLLPAPVIGRQADRIPPISTAEWEEKRALFDEKTGSVWPNADLSARAKFTREYIVKLFWLCVVEDKFDPDNATQTKAEFSHALAVMDRIRGWEEEQGEQDTWVGPRFAASMWVHTKAAACNGQNHMQNYRISKLRSIMEAVNWVCDDALDEHVWVSEQTISLQKAKVLEALQYDLGITCSVQWEMLWFSAPTSLNNDY